MSRKALILRLIALALCVDALARLALWATPGGYDAAVREVRNSDVRFVFIGSSRVAAAIVADEFTRSLDARAAPRARALNLGRGFQTLAEDYFGLRKLASARRGGLEGVVVLIEAPMEVPPLEIWTDSWVHPDYPELLSKVMNIGDLPRFWRESGTESKAKWIAAAALFSPTVEFWGKGNDYVQGALSMLQQRGILPMRQQADLARAGGVLADEASLERARAYAVKYVGEMAARQHVPFADGDVDQTVLWSVIDLVRHHRGRVVLYRMPISSVFQAPYLTKVGKETREAASRALARRDVQVLVPDMSTTDNDFPDLWHLCQSRSADFSRSLARAYAMWSGQQPPSRLPDARDTSLTAR